ncbi:MAG: hypothetical protein MJK18_09980 [Bdellovibrionales bacterium]|nr:hypothetical protein [Bdellovibrionales bacterium]
MRETLLKIIKNPTLHKKWLNTVSHLEYIGARKIIKSLDAEIISLEELQHFYEEAGHALLLKKLGHAHFDSFPRTYEPENLIGGTLGKDYFQDLDQYISEQLGTAKTLFNYLYVTWLIEVRAMKVYSQYNNLLLKTKSPFNINELIKE